MADFNLKAIFEFVDRSASGVKSAERNVGGLEKIIDKATKALTALGVAGAAKAAYQLAELGAQSLRTKAAFEAISGGAGEAAARLDAMRDATRGALSEQQMMASANKLMQMGLADSAAELKQVTTMAVRLGTAMGRDAATSIEEFALLLANQSIPRLDTFGISAGRVRERMAELQSETNGMTREAAFMQATMEIGSEAMARLGDSTGDAALQFERMSAQLKDTKAKFGELLAQGLAPVLEGMYELLNVSAEESKLVTRASDNAVRRAESYDEYTDAVEQNIKALSSKLYIDEQGNLMTKSLIGLDEILIQATYLLTEAQWKEQKAAAVLGPTLAELRGEVQAGGLQFSETGERINGVIVTTHLLTDETDGSTAAFRNADAALSGLVRPAEEAAAAYETLTGSVGGLASALSSFDVSAQGSWSMLTRLAEQGLLTADQVAYLAEQQGIATSEQIEATLTQRALIDAYALGDITVTNLNAGLKALARYQAESTAAAEAEAEGQDEAAKAHQDNAAAALDLAGKMLDAAGAADEETEALERIPDRVDVTLHTEGFTAAEREARIVKAAIDSIPSSKIVRVHMERVEAIAEAQYAAGTNYARGGLAMVGELGPELVDLPRGSRVIPNNQIHNYNYSRGGDTMIVQDSLSMAAIREARYRQEMRERGRMM